MIERENEVCVNHNAPNASEWNDCFIKFSDRFGQSEEMVYRAATVVKLGSQMKCEGRKQKYPGSDQFSDNCDL